MPKRKVHIYKNIDWQTILFYVLLLLVGWLNIYSADYNPEIVNEGLTKADLQLIWIGVSALSAFVILTIDSEVYQIFAYLIYALFIVILIATIFLAPDIKGSHSWLVLGPIRIQPAEFAKFATALALAKLMRYLKIGRASCRERV